MNKKAYKKPTLKVAHLENTDLICQSLSRMKMVDKEVEDWTDPEQEKPQGWGTQW